MRNAFAQELTTLAGHDPRIVLLSGDIGNRLFDQFKARHGERFFNCGVAEQNMMSVAAGLALGGMRPVVYTIVPFVTTRCLEQIRVDVCYHHAPVMIVGVGGGLSYAQLGATHHACEDIAFLRMLPGMTVVCPGDRTEVRLALQQAVTRDGPVYLRLGIKGEPDVHVSPPAFALGRGIVLREGTDVALVSTGNMLATADVVAQRLAASGVSTELISLHTVKPLDDSLLARLFAERSLVVTLEEHSRIGGLGGAVAEWLTDPRLSESGVPLPGPAPSRARLLRIGTPDVFLHEAGDQAHARRVFRLDVESITACVLSARDESCCIPPESATA